jgi:hypothetical protein
MAGPLAEFVHGRSAHLLSRAPRPAEVLMPGLAVTRPAALLAVGYAGQRRRPLSLYSVKREYDCDEAGGSRGRREQGQQY